MIGRRKKLETLSNCNTGSVITPEVGTMHTEEEGTNLIFKEFFEIRLQNV